ncbi:hypothetical protein [Variovorax boronicumulans]|nr:hypothetical protein [Variovorax boronicumulans]GER10177.1 hypothetical protein VHAB30_13320 [Variovorax boronicumulans]GER15650.1 hypothetical protein VCH24_06430 [Variovorax boronicumulans]
MTTDPSLVVLAFLVGLAAGVTLMSMLAVLRSDQDMPHSEHTRL